MIRLIAKLPIRRTRLLVVLHPSPRPTRWAVGLVSVMSRTVVPTATEGGDGPLTQSVGRGRLGSWTSRSMPSWQTRHQRLVMIGRSVSTAKSRYSRTSDGSAWSRWAHIARRSASLASARMAGLRRRPMSVRPGSMLVEQEIERSTPRDEVGQPAGVRGEVHVGVVHAIQRLDRPVDPADVPAGSGSQPHVEVAGVRQPRVVSAYLHKGIAAHHDFGAGDETAPAPGRYAAASRCRRHTDQLRIRESTPAARRRTSGRSRRRDRREGVPPSARPPG